MVSRCLSLGLAFFGGATTIGLPLVAQPAIAAPVLDSDTGARYHVDRALKTLEKVAEALEDFNLSAALELHNSAKAHIAAANRLATRDDTRALIRDAETKLATAGGAIVDVIKTVLDAARRIRGALGD